VLRITVDPNRPDNVYAALEVSGVLRSTDGGAEVTTMGRCDENPAVRPLPDNLGHLGQNTSVRAGS
jgi:hypothetical protein